MHATELLRRLPGWDQRSGPRSHALADALREAVATGTVPAGTRLPAERELAAALSVSRGTVVRAYDRLREAGVATTRHGSGTVLGPRHLRGTARRSVSLVEDLPADSLLAGIDEPRGPATIDLRVAAWQGTAGLPEDAFVRTADEVAALRDETGYRPLGLPALRRQIARHLTAQGLPTDPSEIIVTSGGQQALDLVLTTLTEPGDPVLVEELTYPGLLELLTTRRLRARPLPLGRDGVDHLALGRALHQRTPPLTYLVATHHNPTGRTVPAPLRRLIAEQVVETGGVLIDDATLADVWLDAPPPPPIAASLPEASAHVITIGSVSKWLWAGLRVGWVRASGALLDRLARVKVILDLGTSIESQLTTAALLTHADAVLDQRRAALRSRYETLAGALAEQLPGWRFERPTGGLSLWVDLGGAPGDAIAQLAAQHGVLVPPARVCAANGRDVGAIRLTFGRDEESLRRAVDGLAAAWRDHLGYAAPRGATPIV